MKKVNFPQLIASITLLVACILKLVEQFCSFPEWLSLSTTILYFIAIVLWVIAIIITVSLNNNK